METENKDWKPEVGKTAWYNYHDGSKGNEIREVIVDREENVLGSTSFSVYSKKYGMSWDYVGLGEIFPTPEAALASIKIYDLEGKEVVIPPRPLVLEPKPLEWKKIDDGYFEASDGAFTYQVDSSGYWSVDNIEYFPRTSTDTETGKAAIHEWRVNHLKSMLP